MADTTFVTPEARIRAALTQAGLGRDIRQITGTNGKKETDFAVYFAGPLTDSLRQQVASLFEILTVGVNSLAIRVPADWIPPEWNWPTPPVSQSGSPSPDVVPVGVSAEERGRGIGVDTPVGVADPALTATAERIQQLQAELAQARARIEQLEAFHQEDGEQIDLLTAERDALRAARLEAKRVEIATLIQPLHDVHTDAELEDRLAVGWKIAHEMVTTILQDGKAAHTRIVRLERPAAYQPLTGDKPVARLVTPIGPTVTLHAPSSSLPIVQAVREHGLDAVEAALDAQLFSAGKAAYDAALARHSTRPFTQIPAKVNS